MTRTGAALTTSARAAQTVPQDDTVATSPWWKGATLYQVYPWSYRDSNGDGIGDLPGIIEALPHIASLNVDGIWLSPFFTSPMHDFGYDVADYCDVDPRFGTLDDFDRLIDRAHGLGLKIIIDQVYSHTSGDHPWFLQSAGDRTNPKADWYVWADPKPDGSPPNNWQSVFGGPAWQWSGARKQYYFHNFLTSQPDLNVRHPDVERALLDAARFWLDRGVDGFRLDAINFAMHDPSLRDNPPSGAPMQTVTRPFDMQERKFNQSHPDIVAFLERIRALLDSYGARFTVAEVGGPDPMAEMKQFTAGNTRLNSAYSFDFLYAPDICADRVAQSLSQWNNEGEAANPVQEGWPSWAFSNHDAPRAVSRWADEGERDARARLYLLLLLALRGNAFVYQGEELGLPQGHVPFEALKDPEAIENWPHTLGRDGARTPFPWRANAANAGFTTGEPWLPVDPRHHALAVDVQEGDAASMLNFSRWVIGLRRNWPVLRQGDLHMLDAPAGVLAFERVLGEDRALCVFNLSEAAQDYTPAQTDQWSMIATSTSTNTGRAEPDGEASQKSHPQLPATLPATLPTSLPAQFGYWASRASARPPA